MATTKETKGTYTGEIPNTVSKFFWFAIGPYKQLFFLTVCFVVLAQSLAQLSNIAFKWIVDAVETGDTQTAVFVGMMYPVALFVVQLLYRASGIIGTKMQVNIGKALYDSLIHKLTRHSKNYFSDRFTGSLVSKINNVVRGFDSFIEYSIWSFLNLSVTFLVTAYLTATVSLLVGFVFVLLFVSVIVINWILIPKKRKLSEAEAEVSSELSGKAADLISNIDVVRQNVQINYEEKRIGKVTSRLKLITFKNWLFTEVMFFSSSVTLFVAFLIMMYVLLQNWQSGLITSGDLVFVVAMMGQIVGNLIFVGQSLQNAARTWGEMDEGLKEIIVPLEIIDAPNAKKLTVTEGKIDCRDVTFAYDSVPVFQNLTLSIKAGERIGLVGPSGAGKSTFVSLLLRQHDIESGEILLDEQNIASVTQESLRQQISYVPQEPLLFHRTIAENIKYGKPEATDEEVIAVAKKAQAFDFIEQLPEQYETLVGERGVKLSGGQKQRIAIARAMLKAAPILVLDEATSALDSESEVAIQVALEDLMAGKTVIAVAHRLSTLRRMDRILVFKDGQVVESGSHDELIAAHGTYANLWAHQSGGFLPDSV